MFKRINKTNKYLKIKTYYNNINNKRQKHFNSNYKLKT